MTLVNLLESLESGSHAACTGCAWRPSSGRSVAFGTSCLKHGIKWNQQSKAISMQISQDPAGTTPEETGRLCAVCNSLNPTDKSAQQGIALWRAGVVRDSDGDAGTKYLSRHYWTNAVMHGAKDRDYLESARSSCTAVLRDQISVLAPKVIIAGGRVAAKSLNDIGLLKNTWNAFRSSFHHGAYKEQAKLVNGEAATIFVTYHASARSVNQTVAKLYSAEVEALLDARLLELPAAGEARRFLHRYDRNSTSGRGMRVLLLHWLEIGMAVRSAYFETSTSQR